MQRFHLVDRIRHWSWTPWLGRAAIWAGAFLALAQVGRGSLEELTTPSANAAPRPPPTSKVAPAASRSEKAAARAKPPTPCPRRGAAGVTEDGRVILNTASAVEFDRLPGVGSKRAEAIVALRERLGGRFRRVRDLVRVRGIGIKSLRRLEPLVILDPPEPPEDSDPSQEDPPGER